MASGHLDIHITLHEKIIWVVISTCSCNGGQENLALLTVLF